MIGEIFGFICCMFGIHDKLYHNRQGTYCSRCNRVLVRKDYEPSKISLFGFSALRKDDYGHSR